MRRLWRYRSPLLAAAALVAVAAVLVAPSTRWIAWRQLKAQVPHAPRRDDSFASPLPSRAELKRAAARFPKDVGIQIAAITGLLPTLDANSTSTVAELRQLRARFPDSPLLYVAILDFGCPAVSPGYRERDYYSPKLAATMPVQKPPTDRLIAEFLADADAGRRLDPGNALFPFMRAIALTAARRDAEALVALRAAAACTVWRDCGPDLADARCRLYDRGFDRHSALDMVACNTDPGFRTFATIRSLARVIAGVSEQAEAAGRTDDALAVRDSFMRVCALLREQSTTVIGSLVGVAAFQIAFSTMKHYGENRGGYLPPGAEYDKLRAARSTAHVERYCGKLTLSGHADAARWVRGEYAAGQSARALSRTAGSKDPSLDDFLRLAAWWGAGVGGLSGTSWLIVLGAIAAMASRKRSIRECTPLSPAVRWGVALAFGTILVVLAGFIGDAIASGGVSASDDGSNAASQVMPIAIRLGFGFIAAVVVGVLAARRRGLAACAATLVVTGVAGCLVASPAASVFVAYVASMLAVGGRPRRVAAKPLLATVLSAILSLAALAALGYAVSQQFGEAEREYLAGIAFSEQPVYQTAADFCMTAIAPLSTGLLLACAGTLVGWKRRVPVSVALARGFRSEAIPLASVMLITWAVVVAHTVSIESQVRAQITHKSAHEGRYYAALVGRQWPGPVR